MARRVEGSHSAADAPVLSSLFHSTPEVNENQQILPWSSHELIEILSVQKEWCLSRNSCVWPGVALAPTPYRRPVPRTCVGPRRGAVSYERGAPEGWWGQASPP